VFRFGLSDTVHGVISSYASRDDAGIAIAAAIAGADVVRNMYVAIHQASTV
jgi:hypothetical protein